MTRRDPVVLPYTYVVGQEELKLALELSYVAPRIGGVLVSGDRGTAKSTSVRAFAVMLYGRLPVTLPINATDDRVLGGWRLDELMAGEVVEQPGLLAEANGAMLYIDEVNLLDDHIVNLILDVSSTGILTVQREGVDREQAVEFSLVGTMNPEEGTLRPQLLDRFGLMVDVRSETDPQRRRDILQLALAFDEARTDPESAFLRAGRHDDAELRKRLDTARAGLYAVEVTDVAIGLCADIAATFGASGHRADVIMALAARALASLEGADAVRPEHVARVAPLAVQHRRSAEGRHGPGLWTADDDTTVADLVAGIER